MKYNKFSASGGSICGAGNKATHLSSQKVGFGTERNDWGFQPSQRHCIASHIAS